MFFDFSNTDGAIRYKLMTATITPRPIAWVATRSEGGVVNLAPYSFFNMLGHNPPTVVLGCTAKADGQMKDTPRNIIDTGEFVVNLVTEATAAMMNETAINAPAGVSESELNGIELRASRFVGPPQVKASPVALECRLIQTVTPGPLQTIIIGEVLGMYIENDAILDKDRAYIDTGKLQTIGRMGGAGTYSKTAETFTMTRPEWNRT